MGQTTRVGRLTDGKAQPGGSAIHLDCAHRWTAMQNQHQIAGLYRHPSLSKLRAISAIRGSVLCVFALFSACAPTPTESANTGTPEPIFTASACEDRDDCDGNAYCQFGRCFDVGAGCVRKSECAGDLVCREGSCEPASDTCSTSDECPGTLLCDGFSRTCFDPNATGCLTDQNCIAEPGCSQGCTCESSGQCVPVGAPPPAEPPPGETPPGPAPSGGPIDIGRFRVENREHTPVEQVGWLPEGLVLSPGQQVIIARNASKAEFEAYWGVNLGTDVFFLNAQADGSGIPIINGRERWALLSTSGELMDQSGIEGARETFYNRTGTGQDITSWATDDSSASMPGQIMLPTTGVGLVISQWSDAADYAYEFLGLYYAP